MLINALVGIGKSLETEIQNTEFDSEIVKFINMRYPNPPKMEKIIKVHIKPCILDAFLNLKEKISKFDPTEYGLEDNIDKKLKKQDKQKIIEKIIQKVEPNFDDFKNCMNTEILEYKPDYAYQMLRGDKSGASIYLSPTMFAKISSKKILEFPLWKIKLNIKNNNHSAKIDNEADNFILNFF
ncbi:MAG: hypothetical protein ACTSQS_11195, partial [Promethearchaeota archaeon]